MDVNFPFSLAREMVGPVVVLLLLMSGDIEMNPGPFGKVLVLSLSKLKNHHTGHPTTFCAWYSSPRHPSAADEAWYWLKDILHSG